MSGLKQQISPLQQHPPKFSHGVWKTKNSKKNLLWSRISIFRFNVFFVVVGGLFIANFQVDFPLWKIDTNWPPIWRAESLFGIDPRFMNTIGHISSRKQSHISPLKVASWKKKISSSICGICYFLGIRYTIPWDHTWILWCWTRTPPRRLHGSTLWHW